MVQEIVKLLEFKKAEAIIVIDLRKKVDFTDFFVICSAYSTKHTQGLLEYLLTELEKNGIRPFGIEGVELGQWIVLDYGTVVVHIFYEPIRKVYALEELWTDLHLPLEKGER